jgi:hypothetical protein
MLKTIEARSLRMSFSSTTLHVARADVPAAF